MQPPRKPTQVPPEPVFSLMLDEMPQLVFAIERDMNVVYANKRIRNFLGSDDLRGLYEKWVECIHPDDVENVQRTRVAAMDVSGPWESVRRMWNQSSQDYRWMVVRTFPYREADGSVAYWIGTATDIHEQKVSLLQIESLQAASAGFTMAMTSEGVARVMVEQSLKVFECQAAAICRLDPKTRQLSELASEGVGDGVEALCAVATRALEAGSLLVETGGAPFSMIASVPFQTKNGTRGVMVLGFLHVKRLDATATSFMQTFVQHGVQALEHVHLTEQEIEIRREVETSEQRLKFAIEASDLALWEHDAVRGISWRSTSYARIFGLSNPLPELTVQNYIDQVVPEDRDATFEQIRRIWHDPLATSFNFLMRIRRPNGEIRWIQDRGTIIRDANGAPMRLSGAVLDVTPLKETQEELRRAKEAAEAADRAKTAFVANMSHEFRTPLSAILGFSEFLVKPNVAQEKRESYASGIRRNGQALLKLVEDIMDLSQVESGRVAVDLQVISPRALLDDVFTTFRAEAEEKKIGLVSDIASEFDAAVKGFVSDPVRLRQILLNLVGNAVKFTSSGEVRVRATLQTGGARGMLTFEVCDSGIGLNETQASQLFQPFSQADRSTRRKYGGTGLGLFISRSLARALGGDVELKAFAVGNGATFAVHVVDLRDQMGVRPAVSAASGTADLKGKRVLVVEDTADIRELLRAQLKELGLIVDVAANGREGYEKASGGAFDVIVMDLHMPEMDGFRAASLLRRDGFKRPIIAVTALSQVEDRTRSFEAGFDAFLSKPVRIGELASTIRRLLRRS